MPAPDNGPRQGISTGRNRRTVQNIASKGGNIYTALQRDRQTGIGGSLNTGPKPAVPKPGKQFTPAESLKKLKEIRSQSTQNLNTTLPTATTTPTPSPVMSYLAAQQQGQANVTAAALIARAAQQARGGGGGNPGPGGPIMRQLVRGFRAAGDKRMAKFTKRNKDLMRIWLGQESSMNPKAISPPNNQGDPNYGLFQFARLDPGARPWLEKYIKGKGHGRFVATPFQQAQLAARYFDLTPGDVRRYVREIQAGTYKGWG